MILCLLCVCLINELFESNQGLDDVSPTSNLLKLADNNVILDSPQKPPKKILFETPDPLQQNVSQFKDMGLFLSPATKKIQESIEKATKLTEVVYNSLTLKEVQKHIIQSIDHILSHNLVCEHPAAANFVGTVERNIQEIKEEFKKVVLSQFVDQILEKTMRCVSLHTKKEEDASGKTIQGYCWIVK
jgi:hypothetical protein